MLLSNTAIIITWHAIRLAAITVHTMLRHVRAMSRCRGQGWRVPGDDPREPEYDRLILTI